MPAANLTTTKTLGPTIPPSALAWEQPDEPGELSMTKSVFTAILEREGDVYVALCPELDIASQGPTIEEAT